MKYAFEYTTEQERENIINSNTDKYLIEEKNIREGNFLVFTDVKPLEVEITELKTSNEELSNYMLDVDMRLVMMELGL